MYVCMYACMYVCMYVRVACANKLVSSQKACNTNVHTYVCLWAGLLFSRCLDQIGVQLSEEQRKMLLKTYDTGDGRVNYRKFVEDVYGAFTRQNMEKAPTQKPPSPEKTATLGRPRFEYDDYEMEETYQNLKDIIRNHCRTYGMSVRQALQEFDKVNRGLVTVAQFERNLPSPPDFDPFHVRVSPQALRHLCLCLYVCACVCAYVRMCVCLSLSPSLPLSLSLSPSLSLSSLGCIGPIRTRFPPPPAYTCTHAHLLLCGCRLLPTASCKTETLSTTWHSTVKSKALGPASLWGQ